jgi:hypothetical protein
VDPNADPDSPNNSNDVLRIIYVARGDVTPDSTTLRWTSEPTRFYTIQYREILSGVSSWADAIGVGFGGNNANFNTGHTNATEFYRVRAYRPLGP